MIHKEGKTTIAATVIFVVVLIVLFYNTWLFIPMTVLGVGFLIFILSFFRNPDRSIAAVNQSLVLCPADGKVVAIEETTETEYLNERRIQVSIFMSPLNVHVNRNPISGTIEYYKYHKGKYLAAWNPKSSTENERTTIVYNYERGKILMRQIAGALARRIVCYAEVGDHATQGEDIGFIKLGSRVDLFLPLDANILVSIDDVVKGNITKIAELK